MNHVQRLWWTQAQSDWEVFEQLFQPNQFLQCHSLHYLQMTCEKISKAFAAAHVTPAKCHEVFFPFVRQLATITDPARQSTIANAFGYTKYTDFVNETWQLLPLAQEIDELSPQGAGPNGPNTEYPRPTHSPTSAPANFQFPIHSKLDVPSPNLTIKRFVEIAVRNFPAYG